MKREIHPDAQIIADFVLGKIETLQVLGYSDQWTDWDGSYPLTLKRWRYRAKREEREEREEREIKVGDLIGISDGRMIGICEAIDREYEFPYKVRSDRWKDAKLHPKQKQLDIYHDALRAIVSHGCKWSSGMASVAIEEAKLTKELK